MWRAVILVVVGLVWQGSAWQGWIVGAAVAADPQLLAGVASVDITPEPGMLLWGYSDRTHGATGTLDPLTAKAVVLKCGEVSTAIVALDLGRTPDESLVAGLRAKLKQQRGIEQLFITASHTHAAPSLESEVEPNRSYPSQVTEKIETIILQAADNLMPVTMRVGHGTADLAHNRRKHLPDGRVAMQWRNEDRVPTEPVDPNYTVVRFDRQNKDGEDGKPLAVLLHYACHPVVLGSDNYEYSADYVGAARKLIEDRLQATCLFLQGACGDLNPYVDKTPLNQGGIDMMRKMGLSLGNSVMATIKETQLVEGPASLKVESRTVPVRLRWNLRDPKVKAVLSAKYGRRFDNYLAKILTGDTIDVQLTTVVIDDRVALVGMPGEFFVEFQLDLRERSPIRDTLLVGYTNGYWGYFPTIREAALGGYGGKTATYVAPGAGEQLNNEALVTLYTLLDRLHNVPRAEDFELIEWDEIKGK